ncbi:MAG: RNA-guided pseudouridylation complex pseudouridine synthase subunit Cbf5 [Candidatus Hodarchaeales archaeon]|jgi:H/ACA ribonucleoprotein complex subunit 4
MDSSLVLKLPSDEEFDLIEKATDYTNPKYGSSPEERSIVDKLQNGVINLDKPANPTSHEVAAWVRKILRIKKTGHGGTLDPQVTGCLPIATGRGTRAIQVLLPAGKEYVGIGKVHGSVSRAEIESVIKNLQGKIYQIPPVRSNVKRRLRVRTVYYFNLLDFFDRQYLFRIGCQAGTYIRKICVDVGVLLGHNGHMKELRRTRSGPFQESTSVTLQDLREAAHYYYEENDESLLHKYLQPIENAVSHLPFIVIRDSAIDAVCHGAYLTAPGVVKVSNKIEINNLIVIKSLKNEAVALAQATKTTNDILEMKNGVVARTDRVLLLPGTYPKKWKKHS